MAFNSPVWFNVGVEEKPQCSACFILSVEDTMESILDWCKTEGMIFKGGSGSGINLSPIRSSKEQLSAGGQASGPISFMRGADSIAGSIKSGGKTRRAAKMVVLNVDHPDIEEFIDSKVNEERKAYALGDAGWDMSLNGDAWSSIQFQNANNSVRVTDAFMQAAVEGRDWTLRSIVGGDDVKTAGARELLDKMAAAAWECGDPGMQYDTTVNDWHTCPNTARINASNPCSEYMHVDNSACNLASLNLMKFVDEDGVFDVELVPPRRHRHDLGAGDHRRQLELPHGEDRGEHDRHAPARPRLREPRCVVDVARTSVRLRRRPRVRRRDHRADDRTRVRDLRIDRETRRSVRRVSHKSRSHVACYCKTP